MLSKNQSKLLRSLQRKKSRQELSLFMVEGGKMVAEVLAAGWPVHSLYVSEEYAEARQAELLACTAPVTLCSPDELSAAGSLISNRDAIAVLQSKHRSSQASGRWCWTALMIRAILALYCELPTGTASARWCVPPTPWMCITRK